MMSYLPQQAFILKLKKLREENRELQRKIEDAYSALAISGGTAILFGIGWLMQKYNVLR